MDLSDTAEALGGGVDLAGVVVIVCGALAATGVFARRLYRRDDATAAYRTYRQNLGRAILLGLELLVAGDIIRTVAVSPTFAGVGVLAVIVLVRTFLSFSLEVELTGRWPWQQRATTRPEPRRTPRPDHADPMDRRGAGEPPARRAEVEWLEPRAIGTARPLGTAAAGRRRHRRGQAGTRAAARPKWRCAAIALPSSAVNS